MIDLDKRNSYESTQAEIDQYVQQVYDYAADLIINKNKSYNETRRELINQGVDPQGAATVVENLKKQIEEAKSEAADKDIMWGIIWAAGGIILTFLTGGQYLFWGAVVYGGYRLIHGLANK